MNLLRDIARCAGVGFEKDGVVSWREGCETCLRRTCRDNGERIVNMEPPPIIALECEYLIEQEDGK